jgi:ketosteroid isomerase-like protein
MGQKRPKVFLALLVFSGCAAALVHTENAELDSGRTKNVVPDTLSTADAADEALIRAARQQFNRAIEQRDVEAIQSFILPEYHIVTGRSAQSHGKAEQAQLWAQTFAEDPTFVCIRTTREVRVNKAWGLAEELGNWRCDYTVDAGKVRGTGVYAAKWQRSLRGSWLLQSEVFTTLNCEGSDQGCWPPDPVQ